MEKDFLAAKQTGEEMAVVKVQLDRILGTSPDSIPSPMLTTNRMRRDGKEQFSPTDFFNVGLQATAGSSSDLKNNEKRVESGTRICVSIMGSLEQYYGTVVRQKRW